MATINKRMKSLSYPNGNDTIKYEIIDEGAREDIAVLKPTASSSDIGKFLKVKTVSNGEVTAYEFGSGGSGGGGGIEINDEAGAGDTDVAWSADKLYGMFDDVNDTIDEKDTYVTPEEFGAVGDGTTDDTQAVQAAINYGAVNKIAVKGYKKYKVTSPLTVDTNHLDLEINRIEYTGTSQCITIIGSYNNFKFEQLYCSNSKGIVLSRPTSSKYCSFNKISGIRLFAKGNAVEFDTNGRYILYNNFDIREIKSDTGDCFHCDDDYAGENVFMNSACDCSSGWAVYKCSGRFYNFTLESTVLNGLYLSNGYNYFAGFRVRELCDKIVARINGDDPTAQGGTLIKYANESNYLISKFVCDDAIPYEAIDVSDMYSPEDGIEEYEEASSSEKAIVLGKIARLSWYQEIDAPIRYGNWDTENGYFIAGRKMFVHGGRKICVPYYETEHTITSADYDMRDEQVALNHAKIYPTKMLIGVDSCVIHLPASYCPVGYSEFIVDQTSHTCTIYDYNNSTTPIFNGATLGTGVYRLKAVTDLTNNAIQKVRPEAIVQKMFDSSNYRWDIERIDASGSVTDLNYVTPEMFGAVGDGVTDDSQAVQDACDAGYNVYFDSNKTYYLASAVNIDHDIHLYGGENTVIKTESATSGNTTTLNSAFIVSGTLKKTTSMTSDYTSKGKISDNCGNKFTLSDMTGITEGDLLEIVAEDQPYSYARQYYYLGGILMVGDVYGGHLYTTCDMPWDIENTEDVTVAVYSAPEIKVENLRFVSDRAVVGYTYALRIQKCRNSIVMNCSFDNMWNCVSISHSFNSKVENVRLSNAKYDNTIDTDSYALNIDSCTETVVERISSICAQSCIGMGGTIPNMNTYIRNCEIGSECRPNALGMHENSYNLVIEDCVLSGLNVLGTAIINRCRFIQGNRPASMNGITFCGSHNPQYATLKVSNCIFANDTLGIYAYNPTVQSPIQAFDNIIGLIEVTDCEGGAITWESRSSQYILSNVIQELRMTRWKNCKEIYIPNADDKIVKLIINDCTFTHRVPINSHNNYYVLDRIENLDYRNTIPLLHKIAINKQTYGTNILLPENTPIQFSSNNNDAKFIVTGKNIVSDNASDYVVGSVGGNEGSALTRTPATGSNAPVASIDADGNLVYTQKGNTSSYCVYPVGMVYVEDMSNITISATMKNTGETGGATFVAMIAIVNCDTGMVNYRGYGSAVEATAQGATITHTHAVPPNSVAMGYFYCSSAVANAETTFEDFLISIDSQFAPASIPSDEPYTAVRRTGDGTLYSVPGLNHIMSSETTFNVSLKADYINSAGQIMLDGSGAIF